MEEKNNLSTGYTGTQRLLKERPDWLPIIEACLEEARSASGDFAGAWVLKKAKKRGISWFPNLKPLVGHGVLQRTGGSRGGRRAYYVMPDAAGVEKAIQELKNRHGEV